MDSSLRQVICLPVYSCSELFPCMCCPDLSQFFSAGITLFLSDFSEDNDAGTLEMESKNHTVTDSVSGI